MSTYDPGELLSDDQKPTYLQLMNEKLQTSKNLVLKLAPQLNHSVVEQIKSIVTFKQDKIFAMFVEEPLQSFHKQWSYIKHRLPSKFGEQITLLVNDRNKKITKDISQDRLLIQQPKSINSYSYNQEEKNLRVFALKGQSQEIKKKILQINSALQNIQAQTDLDAKNQGRHMFAHLYSEEKIKQTEQFIKKKNQQRQQRKKRLQAQKRKQQQQLQKKQKQLKENMQKQLKIKKEEIVSKINLKRLKRTEQKVIREQRQQEYNKLKKNLEQKPRLFELLQKNFEKKKQYQQLQKRHKMLSQKRSTFQPVELLKIQEHQKKYESAMKAKAQQRQKRYEEYLEQHQKNPTRRYSSFQISQPMERQIFEKSRAKQKLQKIKHYQSEIRQKYKPKIDQKKKKQMIDLIEQLQLNNHKKMKKVRLQNGSVMYQQIKQTDPRKIGIIYLQQTKQMAAKAKKIRGTASSVELTQSKPHSRQKNKNLNYLQELRKSHKIRKERKIFLNRNNLSFDEKIQRIMLQSEKLNEITRQNEMKLRFGKFKTSQQILNCKQQIDNNYLNIAKMKLKLIKQQSM